MTYPVIFGNGVKDYFMEHAYEEKGELTLTPSSSKCSDLVREVKEMGGVTVVEYRIEKQQRKCLAFLSNLFKKDNNTLRGRKVLSFLREDLKTARFGDKKDIDLREKQCRVINRMREVGRTIGKGITQIQEQGYKGRVVAENYWKESLGDKHAGPEYGRFLEQFWLSTKSKKSFYDWIKDPKNCEEAQELFSSNPIYAVDSDSEHPELEGLYRVDEQKLCVRYLKPEERSQYEKHIESGMLVNHDGSDFSTADHESTGVKGRAAFVIGPDKKFYAGSHVTNQFHHSSFLSGGAVIAAGEIETDKSGKLLAISNKTGHYLSDAQTILDALTILEEKGIDLTNVKVKIFCGEDRGTLHYNNAKQFLQSKGSCPPYRIIQGDFQDLQDILKYCKQFEHDKSSLLEMSVEIIDPEGPTQRIKLSAKDAIEKYGES